jgi:16S rRNA processing protein RimM
MDCRDIPEELFLVGTVLKPFGNRGEVSVQVESGIPERFMDIETVYLCRPRSDQYEVVLIQSARVHKQRALLALGDAKTIDDAALLRGCRLYVGREQLLELDEDEFYVFDLVGCAVVLADGTLVGSVVDVKDYGGDDLLVIRSGGQDHLVPFAAAFFPEVDIAARRLVLTPIEGLFDFAD